MKATIFARIFALVMVSAIFITSAALAKDEVHSYRVYVGGLKVGTLNMSARAEKGRYAAVAKVIGGGIVGAVFDLHFAGRADGLVTKSGDYVVQKYTAEERDGGKTKKRSIKYRRGVPSAITFTPNRKKRSYDISPAKQGGTVDPITAAFIMLEANAKENACNKSVEIFDGSKRTRIKLGNVKPGKAGAFTCDGVFSRLAGYSKKQMAKKKTFPFTMHFKEVNGELVVTKFVSVSIFGNISAVRR